MAKRKDLKKILIIGSGPIVIGQAAEFDYAGTQACLALKEEGYEVVLVNSNPATIMTDTAIADRIYRKNIKKRTSGRHHSGHWRADGVEPCNAIGEEGRFKRMQSRTLRDKQQKHREGGRQGTI